MVATQAKAIRLRDLRNVAFPVTSNSITQFKIARKKIELFIQGYSYIAAWKRNVPVHQGKQVRSPSMRPVCMERRGLVQFFVVLKTCCVIACCGPATWSARAVAQNAEIAGLYPVGM